jgi:hypothetical protein
MRRLAVQTRIVREPKAATAAPSQTDSVDATTAIAMAAVVTKDLALTAGALYAAKRALDTTAQIAIIIAKAKIK